LSPKESTPARLAAGLAAPFFTLLPITGLSITLVDPSEKQSTIFSSDSVAAFLDDLQFTLGEGPTLDTYRSGILTQIDEISSNSARWPMFVSRVALSDVHAFYLFPLAIDGVCVGVVATYRAAAGFLSTAEVDHGKWLSSVVARPAMKLAIQFAQDDSGPGQADTRREVYQAVGMVLAQLGTTASVAQARIRAQAFASSRTIQAVAHDVIARKISFERDRE
jgi:hypothetical protein